MYHYNYIDVWVFGWFSYHELGSVHCDSITNLQRTEVALELLIQTKLFPWRLIGVRLDCFPERKKNGESGEQENRTTITESGSKPVRRVHRKLSCCWKDSNWSRWSEPLKLQLCLDQLFNVPTQLSHLFSVLTTMPMLFSGEPLWVLLVFTFFAKCLF